MPQPPAYNRAKDFTKDFGSETDHSSLNTELDTASNSINNIRTNLAILQADDGKLNPDVVTTDSISADVRNDLSAGILAAVGSSVADAAASAEAAALSAANLATAVTQANASKVAAAASEAAALASKNASDVNAASALASKNTVVAAETNVTTKAGEAATSATNAANSATTATTKASEANTSATNAASSASSASTSATNAASSAASALSSKNAAATSETNAATSATNAAASAASIDPADLVHRTGNESIAGIKTFVDSPVVPSDFCWMTKAVGEPFALRDDLAGVPLPPTNNDAYRYIKLTAADAYNTGVLTSESVSGSAPNVIATAVISLVGSPINGRTVNLLNTERRFIRAGSSGTVEADTFRAHTHGLSGNVPLLNVGGSEGDGPIAGNRAATGATNSTGGAETRPKNQGASFYMRIK